MADDAPLDGVDAFGDAFDASPIGLAVISLDGTWLRVNRALCELVGYDAAQLQQRTFQEITHPDDLDSDVALARELLAGTRSTYSLDKRYLRPNGTVVPARLSVSLVRWPDGRPRHFVSQIEDRTAAQAAALRMEALIDELRHQARHDSLTGLPNRALLQDRIEQAAERARRSGTDLAVLFFDIDHFKHVNDTLGHVAGDRLLTVVADRVRTHLRHQDTLGRLGGDEFVIVLEQLERPSEATIATACDELVAALARPMLVDGRQLRVTSSVGVVRSDGTDGADELLRAADVAMYEAKATGRGRWVRHTEAMSAAARTRFEVHEQLLTALDSDGIEVHYQPIVDLATGSTVGTEALVRLRDVDGTVLLPRHFLEVAEDHGLIGRLGAEVLATAARDSRELPGWVSVNISPAQLADEGFESTVLTCLEASGMSPERLVLEVTESAVLEASNPNTTRNLTRLRAAGVRFALDDFGSGYSSLDRLRHLPVSFIKIDHTFVQGLTTVGSGDLAVVRAVVGMARSLGIPVVAEAVEEELQRGVLLQVGVQLAQGHLFAHPEPLGAPIPPKTIVPGVSVTGPR